MIIKIKTKPNANGNCYGVIVNTAEKTYKKGYGVVAFGFDFHATKTEIEQFIKYNLKINGYTEEA